MNITLDKIIMSEDVRKELDKVLVTASLLGYEIKEFQSSTPRHFIHIKAGDMIYTINFVYDNINLKLYALWIESNKLFRCSYGDFNDNIAFPLKVLNFIFQNY